MAGLPYAVYAAAEELGVVVYQARETDTRAWNEDRGDYELRHFCGHYWYLKRRGSDGRVPLTAQTGPFRTESAALRDAVIQLAKLARDEPRIAKVLRDNALLSVTHTRKPRYVEERQYA